MPLTRALRLCPSAVLLPVDVPAYRRESAEVLALARAVTPLVEPLSLDEAHLDVTATPGDPVGIAARLRDRISAQTGLTASFGVATSKTVAKIASDLRKPRGFVVVAPGEEEEFLRPLPLRALPGLGPSSERRLAGLGLRTLGDLGAHPPSLLERALGRSAARSLSLRARGIDPAPVTPPGDPRSISREETFAADVRDLGELRAHLARLCAEVGRSLRAARLSARTVTLRLRYADFTTLSRQTTLEEAGDRDSAITAAALALLDATHTPGRPVRLLGAGVHGLERQAQLDLFSEPAGARDRVLDAVLDSLRRRFGPAALRRGTGATGGRDLDWHGEDLRAPGDAGTPP
jgi:DNA polymerase-4